MAHIWNIDKSGQWSATPAGDALELLDCARDLVAVSVDATRALENLHLRRLAHPPETWALLCTPQSDVRVNGMPVPLGLAILSDRDELRVPGTDPQFFCTESLPQVEPFPDSAGRGLCPRCKQSIDSGCSAVRCPGCGLWHHATAELPCWTYSDTCAGCAQITSADAGFRWTPEDL
jgi:hypothetical protein